MDHIPFPATEESTKTLCSYNECLSGHRYPIQLTTSTCPDCASPIVAVRMLQCPYCNEPTVRTYLRTDYLSSAMSVMPVCNPKAQSQAETTFLTIEHTHYKQ